MNGDPTGFITNKKKSTWKFTSPLFFTDLHYSIPVEKNYCDKVRFKCSFHSDSLTVIDFSYKIIKVTTEWYFFPTFRKHSCFIVWEKKFYNEGKIGWLRRAVEAGLYPPLVLGEVVCSLGWHGVDWLGNNFLTVEVLFYGRKYFRWFPPNQQPIFQ